ncbi:MAG: hypothetical protein ACRYG8_10025 [Janthinobacterium lividum]
MLADRAYDAGYFRSAIAAIGVELVIPPHPTRKTRLPTIASTTAPATRSNALSVG